ncbi:hypothetical protein [Stutzerimonas xanthomarina]|uniref:hypothetical protein n=1 Tax=Stutzerimonas xanthomarina TaxID=271420 RepID=UPI003AA86023
MKWPENAPPQIAEILVKKPWDYPVTGDRAVITVPASSTKQRQATRMPVVSSFDVKRIINGRPRLLAYGMTSWGRPHCDRL